MSPWGERCVTVGMVSGIPWASVMIPKYVFFESRYPLCTQSKEKKKIKLVVWTGAGENGVANKFCAPEARLGSLEKKGHHEVFPHGTLSRHATHQNLCRSDPPPCQPVPEAVSPRSTGPDTTGTLTFLLIQSLGCRGRP